MPVISTKFKLDGEGDYKKALTAINKSLGATKEQLALVAAQFEDNADSMEALQKKNEVLKKAQEETNEKIELAKKALETHNSAQNKNINLIADWEKRLYSAQKELIGIEKQLKENEEAIEHFGDTTEESSEKTAGLGDVIQSLADKAGIQLPDGLTKAANGMGSVNTAAVGVAAGIGAAIAAIVKIEKALIDMTTEAAAAAKQLQLLSSATNLSVESAQEWDYVLGTLGSSLEEAQGDLSALQEKMMDAAAGTGEGAELFGKLGINVMDTSGKLKDTDTVLRELVETMQLMDDETERNAISSALLGGTGEKLAALYDQEAGALDDLIDKKRELGIASQAEVRELAKVSEAMLNLEQATDAAKTKISAEFAPFLTSALEDIQSLVIDLGNALVESGVADTFGSMLSSVTSLLSVLGSVAKPVLQAFNELLKPIAKVMAWIADAATVIGGIFSWDWDQVATGLGLNRGKGQLSNMQKLEYADALKSTSYSESLGGWSGNATINSDDYVEEMRWIDPSKEPVISTDEWTKLKGVYIGNSTGTDNWRGGWTWVGENGPELMRLPQGSQVMNSQESRDYGGDTYNITIDAKSVKEFEDIVRIVQNQRRLRRMEG